MLGSQVTEMVIFICLMGLWAVYLGMYFTMSVWGSYLLPRPRKLSLQWTVVDLWTTAMRTRETWARDLMDKAQNAQGEALLAVQQMRNLIVSCTLLVMGMAQIMGRLVVVMVSEANLQTIAALCCKDPMTGPNESWAAPEVKVAVPFGATLLSLLCFGQSVRLAVHIGFSIRVQGVGGGKRDGGKRDREDGHEDGIRLDDEVVVMVQRAELYFTLGLRFLYLFIATIFWVLGITALLVSCLTVLVLLVMSDMLLVPVRRDRARAPASQAIGHLTNEMVSL
ncbi:hypothetical protein ABPG75_005947 [Micractinium tetrahymenae]